MTLILAECRSSREAERVESQELARCKSADKSQDETHFIGTGYGGLFVAGHNDGFEGTSNTILRDINCGVVDRELVPVPKIVVGRNVETIVVFESREIALDLFSGPVGDVNSDSAGHIWLQAPD